MPYTQNDLRFGIVRLREVSGRFARCWYLLFGQTAALYRAAVCVYTPFFGYAFLFCRRAHKIAERGQVYERFVYLRVCYILGGGTAVFARGVFARAPFGRGKRVKARRHARGGIYRLAWLFEDRRRRAAHARARKGIKADNVAAVSRKRR